MIKPINKEIINLLKNYNHIVTIEEFVLDGGFGESISSLLHSEKLNVNLTTIGLPCKFVEAGSNEELTKIYGLDSQSILEKILKDNKK